MKFLSKLNPFNKIARLEETIRTLKEQVHCLKEEQTYYRDQNFKNIDEINRLRSKVVNPVKAVFFKNKLKHDNTYYVVSQGGLYPIKGSTLRMKTMSEITRRALMNGFVVYTREDAETLQRNMRNLTTYNSEDL